MEGPDGDLDWHLVDDELHRHFNDKCRAMGAFMDGRVTWELMAGVWPDADADPSNSEPMREFAGIWRDMPKYVFSRTLEKAGWHTTILREVAPEEIRAIKEQPGGDLALGGAGLAASFLRHGLIDEIHVYVHPVVIGRGTAMFQAADVHADLRLAGTRTFGNGVVLLRYELTR
ncbi:dihydrofolate reductase family protein [Streptomyces kanamyceticus]|uniref:Dihydrofolate reductase n=1 Tax=Streptomyces kanamyceticus TaxID=1967 RepID=A0A5J6G4X0_STRKN|nr:dihydrofolate reductase family protein [Streptomyces kanamyceticus]QEU89957.1 dihydrofolate reductase [Streptomyces kanamyceticus]